MQDNEVFTPELLKAAKAAAVNKAYKPVILNGKEYYVVDLKTMRVLDAPDAFVRELHERENAGGLHTPGLAALDDAGDAERSAGNESASLLPRERGGSI